MDSSSTKFNVHLFINQAIQKYLDSVILSRSVNTARTYRYALKIFRRPLTITTFLCKTPEQRKMPWAWLASAPKPHATERLI
jgi:hypothetical protein